VSTWSDAREEKKVPYFSNPAKAPRIVQMEGLETIIARALVREKKKKPTNVYLFDCARNIFL